MRIAAGKVVAGRVELDGELPEGASVTVLALEGDETFEADAETEKMLLESMAQCDDDRTTRRGPDLPATRSGALAIVPVIQAESWLTTRGGLVTCRRMEPAQFLPNRSESAGALHPGCPHGN